jgi:hypothetical protein
MAGGRAAGRRLPLGSSSSVPLQSALVDGARAELGAAAAGGPWRWWSELLGRRSCGVDSAGDGLPTIRVVRLVLVSGGEDGRTQPAAARPKAAPLKS